MFSYVCNYKFQLVFCWDFIMSNVCSMCRLWRMYTYCVVESMWNPFQLANHHQLMSNSPNPIGWMLADTYNRCTDTALLIRFGSLVTAKFMVIRPCNGYIQYIYSMYDLLYCSYSPLYIPTFLWSPCLITLILRKVIELYSIQYKSIVSV